MAHLKSAPAVAAISVLVSIAAASSIHLLNYRAKQSADAELTLMNMKAEMHDLSSLEWHAMAETNVGVETREGFGRTIARIDELISQLEGAQGNRELAELHQIYLDYVTAIERQFSLITAGNINKAQELDESTVEPLFEKLHDRIDVLAERMAELKTDAAVSAGIGTAFALILSALIVAILFWRHALAQARHARKLSRMLDKLQQAQDQLLQSEKLAALGQLVASIAHEVNTPLGAIQAAAGNGARAMKNVFAQLPKLASQLDAEQRDLFFLMLERTLPNADLVTSAERRPALRALTGMLEDAGIEDARSLADLLLDIGVRDDIEAVLPLLRHAERDWLLALAYDLRRLYGSNEIVLSAVERATKAVLALKNYAHMRNSREKLPIDLRESLEMVLGIYKNQIRRGIDVECVFRDVPPVQGYPDELVQVWTNLVHNAVQAMQGKGTLKLAIDERDGYVIVSVTDAGPGIPASLQQKIFEPFFTTKAQGEGTGLGLHICQNIVAKHDGTIKVESEPGRTTFSVWLPSAQAVIALAA